MIATLCHDLDHRGVNNSYIKRYVYVTFLVSSLNKQDRLRKGMEILFLCFLAGFHLESEKKHRNGT